MDLTFLLLLYLLEIVLTVFTFLDGRDKKKWYARRLIVRTELLPVERDKEII